MKNSLTVTEALEKLRNYCAYQERCHREVKNKLYQLGMIPQAIDQIIGTLVSENYLNESRFAQQFAHGKFSIKHWGKRRITRELKARGISNYDIKQALAAIEIDAYQNKIRTISDKKWSLLSSYSLTVKKQKLHQYLSYRGWENELIYAQIDRLSAKD
ncbi:MAG: regulatory protein RecX [Flavobacteriaceae bacterium]